jgi:type II secretion system protein N
MIKRTEDSIDELDYLPFSKSKFKSVFLLLTVFSITFLMYFPLASIYGKFMIKEFRVNRTCIIKLESLGPKLFMPGLKIKNISIPKSCLRKTGSPMILPMTEVSFGGFSFSPVGLVLKLESELKKFPITAYASIGMGESVLKLHDYKVSLERLKPVLKELTNFDLKASGNIQLDGNFKIAKNRLQNMLLKAKSTDLKILNQSIQGFVLPNLALNNLEVEVIGEKNNIEFKNFNLGKKGGDLFTEILGKVKLNQSVPALSKLDLKIDLQASPEILKKYSFLSILLAQFKAGSGRFKIKLDGSAMAPKAVKF